MQPLCSQFKKAARSSSLQSHFRLSNKTKYVPCSSLGTRSDRILKVLKVFFKGCVHIQSCKVCKHSTSRMHETYRQLPEKETGLYCAYASPLAGVEILDKGEQIARIVYSQRENKHARVKRYPVCTGITHESVKRKLTH